MKYSKLVSSNKNFQTSINLQFDLNKRNKIDQYIPTAQSVAILKRYLNAVYNTHFNEENATVLIGPYGRGKSHLLLVLSAIIAGENSVVNKGCLNALVRKINKVDKEAGNLIKLILKQNKPMLPIIINSNHTDITQSFTIALREALERYELGDFFPVTCFDSALSMIETWENQFIDAFNKFKGILKENKSSLIKIKSGLKKCDRDAYKLFCGIYPRVTNGAQFNNMMNTDIVKMYSQVVTDLCEQENYGGIFIIFDEFSKFLESSAATHDMKNFKLIQDFAELSDRSGKNQIHMCCVTHREILDYSQSDSFRTVDGRFKKIYFVASSEQSYELVSNALEFNPDYESFYDTHKADFTAVFHTSYRTGIFNEIKESAFEKIVVKGCFPLHPIAVYSLIRISESVGQNERTLFTFLSQSGENTLSEFLEMDRRKKSADFMTVDVVFDYFADLFKVEIFNPKIHGIWSKANTALKQVDDPDQRKIIKALAVINIIGEDRFLPLSNNIKASVNLNDGDFNSAVNTLTDLHILSLQRNGQYALLTANGVDIRRSIKDHIQQGLVKLDRPGILKTAFSISYMLPRQYNSDNYMMRYFRSVFLEAETFLDYNGNFSELKEGADGIIIYLIADNRGQNKKAVHKLNELPLDECIIICTSESWRDNSILMEYESVCAIEKNKSDDRNFVDELQLFKDDLYKSIRAMVNEIYSPANANSHYYSNGRELNVFNSISLSKELSRICANYYNTTPKINNEMVNKSSLTPPIKKARAKVIDLILSSPNTIVMPEGFGPEVSIFRSAISVLGLDNASVSNDENLNAVLQSIDEILAEGENRTVNFTEIYDLLRRAPYGMRKGVIPIYIAYEMRSISQQIVISFKEKELSLSGELFNNIDENPSDYSFKVEAGTQDRTDYVSSIIHLYDKDAKSCTRDKAVELMQAWFRGLPKFARDHTYEYGETVAPVNSGVVKLRRKLLQYEINSYDFLFNFLPQMFEIENDFERLYNALCDFVDSSSVFISEFKKYLANKLHNCFEHKITGSVFSAMKSWYDSLSEKTRKNIFDGDVNSFLKIICKNTNYDDEYVVSGIAKCVTLMPIEDWSDNTVSVFFEAVDKIISTVNDFENSKEQESSDITITLNIGGDVSERSLSDIEITPIAQTMLNNLETVIEEYGDAISTQEKFSILFKLLKKEIDNT